MQSTIMVTKYNENEFFKLKEGSEIVPHTNYLNEIEGKELPYLLLMNSKGIEAAKEKIKEKKLKGIISKRNILNELIEQIELDALDLIELIECKDPRKAWAYLSKQKFPNMPKNRIAITGTNGKTSTTHFIAQILKKLNKPCLLIGTSGVYENLELIETIDNTTPDAYIIHKHCDTFTKKYGEDGFVVFEATSIALDQSRIAYTQPNIGLFINISQDHLDYHKTMKEYIKSKLKLEELSEEFKVNKDVEEVIKAQGNETDKNHPEKKYEIYGDELIKIVEGEKLKIELQIENKTYEVECGILGNFQGENILSSIVALKKFIPVEKIMEHINTLIAPPGRMEIVRKNIIVDFAHTPDALEKVLKILNKQKTGDSKIICVFGAGGNRDRTKRPIIGEILRKHADKAIITNDNPRNEDEMQIAQDIAEKVPEAEIILDRRIAIEKCLREKRENDICLIAGRGSEEFQIFKNNKKIKFKDVEVIEEILQMLERNA